MTVLRNREDGHAGRLRVLGRSRRWTLCSIRGRGRAFLLVSELIAATLVTGLLIRAQVSDMDLLRFAVLAGLGIGYAEATERVERLRRYLGSDKVWANEASAWSVAGALVLPAGYAGLLVVVIYAHMLLLGRRHQSTRPHRVVFGGASVVYGTLSAGLVLHAAGGGGINQGGMSPAVEIGAALIAYSTVSLVIVVAGAYLATAPLSFRSLLPDGAEIRFEANTLLLGVVTAAFMTRIAWLTPSVLILLGVLHRSTLVRQLQIHASTDARTGLLNPVVWQQLVEKALLRRSRKLTCAAVLLVDLDHFKNINDSHGHQMGDCVIRAVADTLKHELRGYDAVSRYGGDEFIAFLDDVDAGTAIAIAERIRQRIAMLRVKSGVSVTACIGVALTTGYTDTIDRLVAEADAALYQAKGQGRDRVNIATPVLRGPVALIDTVC